MYNENDNGMDIVNTYFICEKMCVVEQAGINMIDALLYFNNDKILLIR